MPSSQSQVNSETPQTPSASTWSTRIRKAPTPRGNLISPSPDSRRRVITLDLPATKPGPSKRKRTVIDHYDSEDDEEQAEENEHGGVDDRKGKGKSVQIHKKQKKKHPHVRWVSSTCNSYDRLILTFFITPLYPISNPFRSSIIHLSEQPQSTGTGSAFVTKKTLQADSDDENNKVKPRGRRSEVAQDKNDALTEYYDREPWHRKGDVR